MSYKTDKKRIVFVQVGFDFDGSVYLPCAAGALAAYCLQDSALRDSYSFSDYIFRREPLEKAKKKLLAADIAAFSCSVWNMEYNKTLASWLKSVRPECTVIFGGHSVSEDADLLEAEDYIDLLMFGEGEEPFAELLHSLPDLSSVPNIAYRDLGGQVVRTKREYYSDISRYPSPYTSGVFEGIIRDNPGTDFLAVLETTRGCPYSCSYCDWCAGKKLRPFPLERVFGDIDWLAEHRIEYCFCADSNFGMLERDLEIARYLVKKKSDTGYPKVFRPCYEKNSDERVFEICKILNSEGMDKGATMAYQTLSEEALSNINRKNLTMEHFSRLLKKYNEAGIPAYSELILGLPGETKESFCRGLCRLLENGQHNSLSVYHCELLPNSEMTRPEYLKKHKIESMKVAFNHIHSAINKNEEVQEYSYLVRSTATLSREDWVYANLFSVCLQCFHSLGILRFFAMYLHTQRDVSYLSFYTALLEYILASRGKLGEMWRGFRSRYESSLKGDWNYHDEKLGNVTWFFEEGAFLEIISDYDLYLGELMPLLKGFSVEEPLFSELLRYQKEAVKKPGSKGKEVVFGFDFATFFNSVTKGEAPTLKKKTTRIGFYPKKTYESLPEFAREVVWYGRRRGATVYHGDELKAEDV